MLLALFSFAFAAPTGMVDVTTVAPTVIVDMRYATEGNFLGYAFYTGNDAKVCWLTPAAAARVAVAEVIVSAQGYHLVMWDCARPVQYQYTMWDTCVKNHGADHCSGLVANPYEHPSGHTYGKVVDLAIARADGTVVELPSKFDSGLFPGDSSADKALPRPPKGSVAGVWTDPSTWTKPTLWTDGAWISYLIMARALHEAGFTGDIGSEWWHWKTY